MTELASYSLQQPEFLSSQALDDEVFVLPVSSAQQRLWFLDQLESGDPTYNLPIAVQLKGVLNDAALEQSFCTLIQRHEILRTTFTAIEGQPMQVIHPNCQFSLTQLDFTPVADGGDARLQTLLTDTAQQPFNLSQSPLLRATLLKRSDTEHILLLVMHHIIADDWSMGVLVQELAVLYPAFAAGKSPTLPELPIQYADFAVWQQQQLTDNSNDQQTHLSYWQQQLAGLTSLQLPSDAKQLSLQGNRSLAVHHRQGAKQTWQIRPDLTAALRKISRTTGSTLFMVLLAAFNTLLYRYTGQVDIAVGSPIANRNHLEVQNLIGFFVNTLVLRTHIHDPLTFSELLAQVRETTLAAYEHQDLPFEKIVEALQPDRSLSQNPLFQVWFALHNTPLPALQMGGLTLNPLELAAGTIQFDLSLEITEQDQTLSATLEYAVDLFEPETIVRMQGHFQTLLEGIVANPDRRLSELPLLTTAERDQLLIDWNATQVNYPRHLCIHQLFEQQVERTPDAIAVVFEEQSLTYQELNQRANQLAHHLQDLGVKPETLVGLCVERFSTNPLCGAPEMLIGLLGILKAGGAYIPLDPSYPQERLAWMLADAQVAVLVTQQQLSANLPPLQGAVIFLDDQAALAVHSVENPVSQVTSDHLAYIIYTSGSTGTPKGVMIAHHSLVNFTIAASRFYEINSRDRVLQFASISFDAAAEEIFPALVQGATLVLRNEAMLESLTAFLHACSDFDITVLDLPTAFWHHLTAELTNGQFALPDTVRLVIIGGERALPERVADWQQHVRSSVRLVNSYGPTETTVVATWCDVAGDRARTRPDQAVAIGHAIDNSQLYVLDRDLHLVPVGIAGELYIGGVGVARGYLNQPKLTAERFIANPFSDQANARLYRTGDLVRYRSDGTLEFLGRIDQQVKIRGFRIELGEIESVLNQHSDVQQAVVVAREDEPSQKRLVAYVVRSPESPDWAEVEWSLREFLSQQLPAYMLPAVFVPLERLPLTPNGKLDRPALPPPDASTPNSVIAPRTTTEKTLAQIWQQILRLEQVSIHDNFFAIGGDSILSLQVIAKANQAGLGLTPKQLFEHQTIAELAAVAAISRLTQAEQGIVTGTVPLTPIQHWFFEQAFPQPHHWNQAVLLQCQQRLEPELIEQTIQHLLTHHDVLRSQFIQQETEWQQIIAATVGTSEMAAIDLSAIPESEQNAAIAATANELQASLNLATGSLLKVALFDLGAHDSQRLLLVIHHLVVDGVSWRILLEDLQTVYQQLRGGEAVQLPAKTTSFNHWSEQLQKAANAPELRQELKGWLTDLNQPIAQLPIDQSNGENTVASAQTISVMLSETETRSLLQDAPRVYHAQINEVLLSALIQTLTLWIGDASLLIDLEGHGREELFSEVDLSRTVGWFTSVFPVRLTLNSTSPAEALTHITAQLRQIPKRGIGYGLLRYLSSPEVKDQLQTVPQAEILFNYLGQFDSSASAFWQLSDESSGSLYSPQAQRSYLLEINSFITQGQLRLDWTYSDRYHHRSTIAELAEQYLTALRLALRSSEGGRYAKFAGALIADSQSHVEDSHAEGYSLSDFSLTGLNATDLDNVFAMVEFEGGETV